MAILKELQTLAIQVVQPNQSQSNYPQSLDTSAKRALYDNFGKDEVLANKIDTAIRYTKKADWVGDRFKEREIAMAFMDQFLPDWRERRELLNRMLLDASWFSYSALSNTTT